MLSKKIKNGNGITLVALVVTIIILLILAGISISTLTNIGIFGKAQEAKEKSEETEKEQNKILGEYETAIDQYDENTLVYKVNNGTIKVGDYVSYIPDTVTQEDEKYKTLISNMGAYSGSNANTTSTLMQENNLKWRVLDVKDGQVRLISATPTESAITLYGYNRYNNVVKLLDDTCSTLYINSEFASKVQNLKIEDIQDKMKTDYTKIYIDYGHKFSPKNKYYPSILLKEKGQKITANENIIVGTELNLSEQKELLKQTAAQKADVLEVTYSFWTKDMYTYDFNKSIYYNLFISDKDYYSTYWLSSRCVIAEAEYAAFDDRYVGDGIINANFLHGSYGDSRSDKFSFRPVVTLNSNVQVDKTNLGNGTENMPYNIK